MQTSKQLVKKVRPKRVKFSKAKLEIDHELLQELL